MKKGKWNYTQDITYEVILVRLLKSEKTPCHWQNAFVGEIRQVVKVHPEGQDEFYIDNEDGSGLLKIERGGGPDSYSAHVGPFEWLSVVPEKDWIQWNKEKHLKLRQRSDDWMKENHLQVYERMQSMKKTIALIRSGDYHIGKDGVPQPGKLK